MEYDYLIVGSGLFGSIVAYEMTKRGKNCLVIEKRSHIGGNVYTENIENINVHKYGAHIFHTDNKEVWNYINQFADFNRYTNSPVANYKGELYNLPFNMNTFYQMWGVKTPQEAKAKIEEQKREFHIEDPQNLNAFKELLNHHCVSSLTKLASHHIAKLRLCLLQVLNDKHTFAGCKSICLKHIWSLKLLKECISLGQSLFCKALVCSCRDVMPYHKLLCKILAALKLCAKFARTYKKDIFKLLISSKHIFKAKH